MKKASKCIIIVLFLIINIILCTKVYATPTDVYSVVADVANKYTTEETEKTEENDNLVIILKKAVASWYVIFRQIAMLTMLLVLIYIGIRMAISTIASEKAMYKQMLVDWIVGFVLLFMIHYFMILVITINESLVNMFSDISTMSYEGTYATSSDTQISLYETVRTRAYDIKATVGFSGMVMYIILVWYTVRFALVYIKRYLTIIVLTIISPIVVVFYSINKVGKKGSPILSKWFKEYTYNILLQSIHAMMYSVFVNMALKLAEDSLAGFLLMLIIFNFMLKASGIFRKIFKMSGGILSNNADKSSPVQMFKGMKDNVGLIAGGMAAGAVTKSVANLYKKAGSKVLDTGFAAYIGAKNMLGIEGKSQEEQDKKSISDRQSEKMDKKAADVEEKQKVLQNAIKEKKSEREIENARKRLSKSVRKNEKYTRSLAYNPINPFSYKNKMDRRRLFDTKNYKDENGKLVTSKWEYNAKKDDWEKIDGINIRRRKLKDKINEEDKNNFSTSKKDQARQQERIDQIKEWTKQGVLGMGGLFFGLPLFISDPKLGATVLGVGISNTYKHKKAHKNAGVSRKELRRLKRGKRANKNNKYNFNRFNNESIKTIKNEIQFQAIQSRYDANIVDNGLLKSGMKGLLKATYSGKTFNTYQAMQTAFKKDEMEMFLKADQDANELKYESTIKEYNQNYNELEKAIDAEVDKMEEKELIVASMYANEEIKTYGNNDYQIKDSVSEIQVSEDIIDNAITSVAKNFGYKNIEELDLNNASVVDAIAEELKYKGVLNSDAIQDRADTKVFITMLEQRKQVLEKSEGNRIEEQIVEDIIIQYMDENDVKDGKDIDDKKLEEFAKQKLDHMALEAEQSKNEKENQIKNIEVSDVTKSAIDKIRETVPDSKKEQVNIPEENINQTEQSQETEQKSKEQFNQKNILKRVRDKKNDIKRIDSESDISIDNNKVKEIKRNLTKKKQTQEQVKKYRQQKVKGEIRNTQENIDSGNTSEEQINQLLENIQTTPEKKRVFEAQLVLDEIRRESEALRVPTNSKQRRKNNKLYMEMVESTYGQVYEPKTENINQDNQEDGSKSFNNRADLQGILQELNSKKI